MTTADIGDFERGSASWSWDSIRLDAFVAAALHGILAKGVFNKEGRFVEPAENPGFVAALAVKIGKAILKELNDAK